MPHAPFALSALLVSSLLPAVHVTTEVSVQRLTRLPEAVASFGAAVHDGWLYVLCGHVGQSHVHSTENLSAAFRRTRLDAPGEWQELAGGAPLQSVALVAAGARLVRVGGMGAHNRPGEEEDLRSSAETWSYDPAAGSWERLADLPAPRSSHDAAVAGHAVVVAGGWRLDGAREPVWHDTACVLDLERPEPAWRELPQPFRRRAASAVAVRGGSGWRVYVMGGLDEEGEVSQRVDVLDLATGSWSRGPDLPEWGFGTSAAAVGDRPCVSGRDGWVHRLTADGERWERVAEQVVPRIFHRLVADGEGRVLALGGATRGGHVPWVETLALDGSRVALHVLELPFAGRAEQRQGLFVLGDTLVAFGGNASSEAHAFEPESFLDECWRVDLPSGRVERGAALPQARQSMGTFASDDVSRGLALGGFGHDGEVARSFDGGFEYDLEADAWKALPAVLPGPTTQFGLAASDGDLWLLGGLDYDPRREPAFREQDRVLRTETDARRSFGLAAARLSEPRRAFGVAALDGRLHVVGGMREGFAAVETFVALEPDSGDERVLPPPARHRLSPDLMNWRGRLLLAGGSSRGPDGRRAPDARVELYEPEEGGWSTIVESLPFDARHVRLVAWRGRPVVYAARASEGRLLLAVLTEVAPSREGP